MSGMTAYYVSRAVIAGLFAALFLLSGASWWQAALIAAAALAFFFWAPGSGRYRVTPEAGALALSRDERSQWINDRAGRTAFVVVMLAVGAAAVYAAARGIAQLPIESLGWLLILGIAAYYLGDVWLRRRR